MVEALLASLNPYVMFIKYIADEMLHLCMLLQFWIAHIVGTVSMHFTVCKSASMR